MKCRICRHEESNPKIFQNSDRMFQGEEIFDYFECSECGTLQIVDVPINLAKYYPDNYYSLQSQQSFKERILNSFRDQLFYFDFPKILKNRIAEKMPFLALEAFLKLKPNKQISVLDVGCGEGKFLKSIFDLGFKNVIGIEPFALQEKKKPYLILRKTIFEVDGKYDLITFNHVLEHIEDVHAVLEKCKELLSTKGKIMIRVPVKDSYAYEFYGKDWLQWDAPRHFQILTRKAFDILALQHHLTIENYYCDSYRLQFTGSEKYKRGLAYQTSNSVFSKYEIRKFSEKSKVLNRKGKGDQVVVILREN